ncbi:DUF2905 domain-containing protein [Bacteroidota bacterium]
MPQLGKIIIIIGIFIVLAGLVIYLFGDKLGWMGHLPGDIRIERENFKFYFPITTMVIFSVVLTILIRIVSKLF